MTVEEIHTSITSNVEIVVNSSLPVATEDVIIDEISKDTLSSIRDIFMPHHNVKFPDLIK